MHFWGCRPAPTIFPEKLGAETPAWGGGDSGRAETPGSLRTHSARASGCADILGNQKQEAGGAETPACGCGDSGGAETPTCGCGDSGGAETPAQLRTNSAPASGAADTSDREAIFKEGRRLRPTGAETPALA